MFNGEKYFKKLVSTNVLMQKIGFEFKRVTGVGNLEEVVQSMLDCGAMFALQDSVDGVVVNSNGRSVYRRVFICYLFKMADIFDMDSHSSNLEVCRTIFFQVLAKMIEDSYSDEFTKRNIELQTDTVYFKEMKGYQLNGASGMYFVLNVDEVIGLCHNPSLWNKIEKNG